MQAYAPMAQRQRHNVEDVDGAGSNPAGCTETDPALPPLGSVSCPREQMAKLLGSDPRFWEFESPRGYASMMVTLALINQ